MASSKPAKDSNTAVFIVVVLLLTLTGAGAGFAVGSVAEGGIMAAGTVTAPPVDGQGSPARASASHTKQPSGEQTETGSTEVAAVDDAEFLDPAKLRVIAIPPILTTLAQPKGKWIRLEGSILTTTGIEEPPELLAERAGEQVLTFLRSLRLDQIEGTSNMLALREDLTEMLRVLSKDQVKGILISGLVVE